MSSERTYQPVQRKPQFISHPIPGKSIIVEFESSVAAFLKAAAFLKQEVSGNPGANCGLLLGSVRKGDPRWVIVDGVMPVGLEEDRAAALERVRDAVGFYVLENTAKAADWHLIVWMEQTLAERAVMALSIAYEREGNVLAHLYIRDVVIGFDHAPDHQIALAVARNPLPQPLSVPPLVLAPGAAHVVTPSEPSTVRHWWNRAVIGAVIVCGIAWLILQMRGPNGRRAAAGKESTIFVPRAGDDAAAATRPPDPSVPVRSVPQPREEESDRKVEQRPFRSTVDPPPEQPKPETSQPPVTPAPVAVDTSARQLASAVMPQVPTLPSAPANLQQEAGAAIVSQVSSVPLPIQVPAQTPLAPSVEAPVQVQAPVQVKPPETSAPEPPRIYVEPQVLKRANPVIPSSAQEFLSIDTEIDVTVTIDEDGQVTDARVTATKGGGAGLLTAEALKAARKYRFRPAKLNTRTVTSKMALTFRFVRH